MMSWHWAADMKTMALFRPAAVAIGSLLGPEFDLIAAKFIIASEGECRNEDSRFHDDFGPRSIPEGAAVTALMPLHPAQFPEQEGNLEWLPWERNKKENATSRGSQTNTAVHKYRVGEAAVFDGKLLHRTQPFSAMAFRGSCKVQRGSNSELDALSGMRVLASLYFARLNMPWEGSVRQVLFSQGAPPLPPLPLSCAEPQENVSVASSAMAPTTVVAIRAAAEKGNDEAQILLAKMYLKGEGVLQSKTQAAKWLRRAAEHGGPEAGDLLEVAMQWEI